MALVRYAFFGTSDIAAWALEEMAAAGFAPALIVTPPDRPAGRKQAPTPPAVKMWAQERGVDVLQPERLSGNEELLDTLRNSEWDVFVVIDYGKILPREILEIPRKGVLNIHPSLLPRLRGASPIRSAILGDERITGVTIMLMDEKMDHGPIIAQAKIEFSEEEGWPLPYRALREILSREGGKLMAEVLPDWISGKVTPTPQDHSRATYTKKFEKEDAEVNLSDDPRKNLLKIRAFDENPNAFYFHEHAGKKIRVLIKDAEVLGGKLVLVRVVPEGKKEMFYETFLQSLGNKNFRPRPCD